MRLVDREERSATWLELFFDLCFVAAIAALGVDLHSDQTWEGYLRFAGLFVPIWWGWMGITWYATAFDTDDPQAPGQRLTLGLRAPVPPSLRLGPPASRELSVSPTHHFVYFSGSAMNLLWQASEQKK